MACSLVALGGVVACVFFAVLSLLLRGPFFLFPVVCHGASPSEEESLPKVLLLGIEMINYLHAAKSSIGGILSSANPLCGSVYFPQ